jgi:hypothetical protein
MRRIACVLTALLLPAPGPATAATFVVDSTSAANLPQCTAAPADCSLPGAISAAGLAAGADTVAFDIPMTDAGCTAATGVCRIVLGTPLPAINQPLVIDGYTQPGALPNTIPAPGANNAQLKIEVTSSSTLFDPLGPNSTTLTLRGLALFIPSNRMVGGFGSPSIVVQGNWIGVTAAGTTPDYSTGTGALVLSAFFRSIVVGGPAPGDRNVLAGSGRDASGLPGGGGNELRANSISGSPGLVLFQGNLVGLAPDGITPLPFRDPLTVRSGDDGFDTPDIRILDNRFARPVRSFSGNFGGALAFSASRVMTTPALVQGNVFGLGVDGSRPGVERDAITISLGNSSNVPRVRIGGTGAGEGNLFAATTAAGTAFGSAVSLPSGSVTTFVEFAGNRMLGNDGIGLDFPTPVAGGGTRFGRSPNDAGDADTGANRSLNHPDLTAYSVAGASFSVTYRVDTAPANATYPLRIDFYRALGDEGEVYLDSDVYTAADAQQPRSVVLDIPPGVSLGAGDVLVAVATDADGVSSEFSWDPVALAVTDTPDPHPAGAPFTVDVEALAQEGPFRPNGVVDVSMNSAPVQTCTISLEARAPAGTSGGSCTLIAPAAGTRTITATYRALRGAFAGADGLDVVATTSHTATTPGPEQVGFTRCRQRVVEGEVARVLVPRNSGGVVQVGVDFAHVAGTATPVQDYTPPANQVLTWAPGDFAPKVFDIPIAADAPVEPLERFRLTLSQPTATAILPFAQLDVEIMDGLDEVRFGDSFEPPACLP